MCAADSYRRPRPLHVISEFVGGRRWVGWHEVCPQCIGCQPHSDECRAIPEAYMHRGTGRAPCTYQLLGNRSDDFVEILVCPARDRTAWTVPAQKRVAWSCFYRPPP